MNTRDPRQNSAETEARAQAEAERAEREGLASGLDARVDRYRMVVRALRQPLPPQLPSDFAARVAAIAERRGRGDGFEDWLVMLLLLGMGLAGLAFVGPTLVQALRSFVDLSSAHVPWHQVVLGAAGVGVVAAIERGWVRLHPGAPVH